MTNVAIGAGRLPPCCQASDRNAICGRCQWRDILVQTKKVPWIINRFDCSEPLPALPIGLGNAISFVAAHEIDVNSGNHRWAQPSKQTTNPPNVCGILGRVQPVCEKIEDKGRT